MPVEAMLLPTSKDRGDSTTGNVGFERVTPEGSSEVVSRALVEEVPVAIAFNGIGYAVLMATPQDIGDLVQGFALAERLVLPSDPPLDVDAFRTSEGIIARANLRADQTDKLSERVRHRVTDSSCGLCGIDNLQHAIRPLPQVTANSRADRASLFRALGELQRNQPLNAETGAAHAAALVGADGRIRFVREDVGRHNAFDKLIGAMRRNDVDWDGGFALLSSRCSYELVEKAVLANCPLLVTISAPTLLATRTAMEARLKIAVLARNDAILLDSVHWNQSASCPRKAHH